MELKKNIIANYFGQAWVAVMGLVFVPVYIRYLGVEAWGLVGFMSMMHGWFALLDMGLTTTLSREMARFKGGAHSAQSIRDLLRSLELIYGGLAIVIVALTWFIAPLMAVYWFNAQKLSVATITQAVNMMGFVIAARMVEQVYRGALQGLQLQVWFNGMQSILAVLRWAGVICVLTWISSTIEAFFLWQALVSLLSIIVFANKTYCWLPKGERLARFDMASVMRIRRFAGGVAVIAILSVMLTQVDKLLLSKLVSLENFGFYILATSVAYILQFLIIPIVTAISPHFIELVTKLEKQKIIDIYHYSSQWLSAVLIPAALMMSAFAEPLLYIWTGNIDLAQQVAPLLTLLSLGTLCHGLMHIPYCMQLAHSWTGFAIRVNIIAVSVIVPTLLLVVPRYGTIGAAWVWLTLNICYVFVGIHFMHIRLLPAEKWRWYKESVFKPLIVGSAIVLVLRHWVVLPQNRILMAAALLGIGLLVLGLVLWTVQASRVFLYSQIKKLYEYV